MHLLFAMIVSGVAVRGFPVDWPGAWRGHSEGEMGRDKLCSTTEWWGQQERDRADTGALGRGSREEVTEEAEKKNEESRRRRNRMRRRGGWWFTGITLPRIVIVSETWIIGKQTVLRVYIFTVLVVVTWKNLPMSSVHPLKSRRAPPRWKSRHCHIGHFNFNSALTALRLAETNSWTFSAMGSSSQATNTPPSPSDWWSLLGQEEAWSSADTT